MKKTLIKYLFLIVCLLSIIYYFNVSKVILDEDLPFIKIYQKDIQDVNAEELTYNHQIILIKKIQQNVLEINPKTETGIPEGQPRRPENLINFKGGLCFDRSFSLELIFQKFGFDVRHVSLFRDIPNQNKFIDLATKGLSSHSITEVKTKKGWLIVDSNKNWIGLDSLMNPYSMKKISLSKFSVKWMNESTTYFYNNPSHYVYGLYSRHGYFHPPYVMIPDYNFNDLIYNFYD